MWFWRLYLLSIDVNEFHVHRVNCSEDGSTSLDNAFPRLRHRNRSTGGQEDRFISGTEGQVRNKVSLNQDYFLVSKSHLTSSISWDIHSTKKHSRVRSDWWMKRWRGSPHQFCLYRLVILLFDDVVDGVSMNQQVLLKKESQGIRSWRVEGVA